MDRVFIEHLVVQGKHGVHEREREIAQEFVIDISVGCDLRAAAASDAVGDTIDYDALRAIARDAVENNSFFLLERLVDTIAKRILGDARISSVAVTIRKTGIYADCTPGVTMARDRT